MIIEGTELDGDITIKTQVAIVGSGCGGGVMAKELADAGFEVVVVEEGGHYDRSDYSEFSPSETLRYMYRDYGGTPVVGFGDTPLILLQAGRCVGGSSVVNGGVCFRTPDYVIDRWRKDRGLPSFTLEKMEGIFERVEREISVQKVPENLHNRGVQKIKKTAEALGYSGHTIKRNVVDCDACCRCIFGCPHDKKQSVLITYLDKALESGARVYSDFRVDKITTRGGKATGLKGSILDRKTGRRCHRFEVKANIVILAAGAIGSPLLLKQSRLARRSGQVGRNLTLHPGSRVYGIFEDTIDPWKGAFQSYVIDQFGDEGIKLINILPPPGVIAATLPGFREENWSHMKNFRHLSAFGVMISDVSTGRVRNPLGMFPMISYRMKPVDKAKLIRGVKVLADLYFEAGAKKVYLPFHNLTEVKDRDEIHKIEPKDIPGKLIESGSQHPLGTCRMGPSPDNSVVNEFGETHNVKNLFIADGSVVPTSVAVNPQITVMALATKVADYILDHASSYQLKPKIST